MLENIIFKPLTTNQSNFNMKNFALTLILGCLFLGGVHAQKKIPDVTIKSLNGENITSEEFSKI